MNRLKTKIKREICELLFAVMMLGRIMNESRKINCTKAFQSHPQNASAKVMTHAAMLRDVFGKTYRD